MPYFLRAYDLESGLALFQGAKSGDFGLLEEILPGYWEERPLELERIAKMALTQDHGRTLVFEHIKAIKEYLHTERYMPLEKRIKRPG